MASIWVCQTVQHQHGVVLYSSSRWWLEPHGHQVLNEVSPYLLSHRYATANSLLRNTLYPECDVIIIIMAHSRCGQQIKHRSLAYGTCTLCAERKKLGNKVDEWVLWMGTVRMVGPGHVGGGRSTASWMNENASERCINIYNVSQTEYSTPYLNGLCWFLHFCLHLSIVC